MSRIRSVFAVLVLSALMVAVAVAPSLAQPQQTGLVNVTIEDVGIQIPVSVAVAANVCDVTVAVASSFVGSDESVCEADAQSIAEAQQEVGRDNAQGPPQK